MKIKINCDCGQNYSFDIEPVNGRMPATVECPSCGVDGTERANAAITSQLAAPAAASPGRSPMAPPPAPRPAQSSSSSTSSHRLPASSAARPAPEALTARSAAQRRALAVAQGRPHGGKVFLGALAGAASVTALWFGIWKGTGHSVDLMAIAVGWVAGLLAQRFGRSSGMPMAVMVTLIAAVFMLGFEYFRLRTEMDAFIAGSNARLDRQFEAEQARAKQVVESVRFGTDEEIIAYITKQASSGGSAAAPVSVTSERIRGFRLEVLPRARAFLDKQTRETYRRENQAPGLTAPTTTRERWRHMGDALGTPGMIFIMIGLVLAWLYGKG